MPDDDTAPESIAGEIVSEAYAGPGDWLPLADAARRLGISERTLWRRVTAGQYQRQVRSGKAHVLVPLAGSVPIEIGLAVPATPDVVTLAVIEELRRQREDDTERLTRQAAEIQALAERAAAAEAQRDLLAADLARIRAERARPWLQRILDNFRGRPQ